MFQKALQIARQFTWPVIVSQRRESGKLSSQMATHTILNEHGWTLTAYHVVKAMENLSAEVKLSSGRRGSNRAARRRHDVGRVTDWASWWGEDNWTLTDIHYDEEADLAVGRLYPFDPKRVAGYPVFKKPDANFVPGVQLCKLGFPFFGVVPRFDPATRSFSMPAGTLPVPLFPVEGMFIRTQVVRFENGRKIPFVETSSPGLPGQSGGPTFDEEGRVWAMQSRTTHYPLDFGNSHLVENFNTGVGLHAKTILECLEKWGIAFQAE
ncbi:MAG: serine protease [Deltaproteobacteria bacterium]|nr:serine protease [Deltaproteobacteria bacterium]